VEVPDNKSKGPANTFIKGTTAPEVKKDLSTAEIKVRDNAEIATLRHIPLGRKVQIDAEYSMFKTATIFPLRPLKGPKGSTVISLELP